MKLRKLFAGILCGFMLAGLLAGCGGGSGSNTDSNASGGGDAQDTYVMKIAHAYNRENAIGAFYAKFMELVEEKSEGRIQTEEHPNSELGSEPDVISMAQMGEIAMTTMAETSASLDPANINIWCLPYLFDSYEDWEEFVSSDMADEMMSLENTGLECVAFMNNGYREVTANKPINSVEDLKGLKIRTSSSVPLVNLFEALGAAPSGLAYSELFSALETGAFEAQENAYNTILSGSFYEVQKYVAVTNHVLSTQCIVLSETWMDKLPDDLKQIVYDCVEEAEAYQHELFKEINERDHQTLLENGMQETTPDLAPFAAAAETVYEKFFEEYPESRETVEAILAMKD